MKNECPSPTVLRLCVAADGDPNVLTRILGYFQNLNITPRRVVAEVRVETQLALRLDVSGISEERMVLITAKTGEIPSVISAHWHRL
jgi:hypothetical protein